MLEKNHTIWKLNAFIKVFRSFESSIHDEFKNINIPCITYHMTVNNRSETSRNMEDHFRGISDLFEIGAAKDGFRQSDATIVTNKADGRASFSPFPTEQSLVSPTNENNNSNTTTGTNNTMGNINNNDSYKLNVPHNNGVVIQDRDSMELYIAIDEMEENMTHHDQIVLIIILIINIIK